MINIKLNKKEAERFFGNMSRIAELLSMHPSTISRWPEQVPQGVAWALQYASKLPKFAKTRKRFGHLKYEIEIK